MSLMRPLLALSLAAVVATPVLAQQARPTLLDFFSPDRIAARMLQMGVMSLRTQLDVVYGGISVSVMDGSATLSDVALWPPVEWPVDDACKVTFDRLLLQAIPFGEMDRIRLKAQATGGVATLDCLPPDTRRKVSSRGIERISLPRITIDAAHRISTAATTLHAYARADGLGAASVDADFDYLWFEDKGYYGPPQPVAILKDARLTLENLGAWEKAKKSLPPMFTDPDQFRAAAEAALGGIMGVPAEGTEPSPERALMLDSLKTAWTGFLADPRRIVIETGFPSDQPKYLNLKDWERNPDQMLDDLQPRAALVSQPARAILPVALISKAVDTPDLLSDDERVTVGTAFATGIGAPRDLASAEALLEAAVANGDGAAAMALARAVEGRDPEKAYTLALKAAEKGTSGAASVLDRLEAALPFATVLRLQGALVEGVEHPVEALEQITSVRSEAAMRMTGNGRTRSYGIAELWALIGAAAGDAESAEILAAIDQKVQAGGADAAEIWAAQEANAVELARSAWIGFDLPSSFGGVK